jgi:hypothetical protein
MQAALAYQLQVPFVEVAPVLADARALVVITDELEARPRAIEDKLVLLSADDAGGAQGSP